MPLQILRSDCIWSARTDWFSDPKDNNMRLKITRIIMDEQMINKEFYERSRTFTITAFDGLVGYVRNDNSPDSLGLSEWFRDWPTCTAFKPKHLRQQYFSTKSMAIWNDSFTVLEYNFSRSFLSKTSPATSPKLTWDKAWKLGELWRVR